MNILVNKEEYKKLLELSLSYNKQIKELTDENSLLQAQVKMYQRKLPTISELEEKILQLQVKKTVAPQKDAVKAFQEISKYV